MRPKDFLNPSRCSRLRLLPVIAATALLAVSGAHAATTIGPPSPPADWEKLGTPKADRIVVYKAARRLELRHGDTVLRTYHIALGRNPVGPKIEEGDGKTPEGTYLIDRRNIESEYHLALHISYPEEFDTKRAAALHVSPGGSIMIHGEPNILNAEGKKRLFKDWTAGCIALSNTDIDEVWRLVDDGTAVDIYP
jgi:murein L,D-transpeptidase YafK